jgi:hypothetical protein
MSNKHLKELEDILNTFHFIINRIGGNEYDISETWEICRPDGTNKIHIDFEGLVDMKTLPVEQKRNKIEITPNFLSFQIS